MVFANKLLKKITLICLLAQSLGIAAAQDEKQSQKTEPTQKTSWVYKGLLGIAGSASTLAAAVSGVLALERNYFVGNCEEMIALNQKHPHITRDPQHLGEEYQRALTDIVVLRAERTQYLVASAICCVIAGYTFKKLWNTMKKEKASKAVSATS